jgi:hypothetical protein
MAKREHVRNPKEAAGAQLPASIQGVILDLSEDFIVGIPLLS